MLRLATRRPCRGGLAAAELPTAELAATRARLAARPTGHALVGAAGHLDGGLPGLAAHLAANANLLRQCLAGFGQDQRKHAVLVFRLGFVGIHRRG